MLIGLVPGEIHEYVLKQDRGSEAPTVFLLRVLTDIEYAEIEDAMRAEAGWGTTVLKTLRVGLRGWRGFKVRSKDGTLADAPFEVDSEGRPTSATLSRLRPNHRHELFAAIVELQNPTEDELGKS